MSYGCCQECGKMGTRNHEMPGPCEREDCPQKPSPLWKDMFPRSNVGKKITDGLQTSGKPEAEGPYEGSPLQQIDNLRAALTASEARVRTLETALRAYEPYPARIALVAVALNKTDPEAAQVLAELSNELKALGDVTATTPDTKARGDGK